MAPPTVANGPWWFHGVFVYDGASEELAEFFETNIHDLDSATGVATTLSAIGHPNVTGKVYERLRTPETIWRQADAAKDYARLVGARGGRGHHRRRETEDLIEILGVARADLPCVVFLTSPRHDRAPILRVERHWLSTPKLLLAFRDALVRHLANDRILGLGEPGKTTTAELVERVHPVLDAIREEMESAEAAEATKGKAHLRLKSMPVPPGTNWTQVRIAFVDGHTVDVVVPGNRASVTYEQMGFLDRRSGRPDKQWELLGDFASNHGEFGWGQVANRGRYEKRVEELSRKLRWFFWLNAAPFKLDATKRRWQANFTILPED